LLSQTSLLIYGLVISCHYSAFRTKYEMIVESRNFLLRVVLYATEIHQ